MSAYYSKELPENPIFILGRAYRFSLMKTDDPELINHLDNASKRGVGGVIKITEEEYQALFQKKTQSPPISQRWEREEVKQKLPNYNRPRFVSKENAAARDKKAQVIDQPQPVDLSAYIPKTATGLLK